MKSATMTVLETSMKKARRGLIMVGFFSFFINLLMLAGPLYMLQVYDRVLTSRSTETLIYITLIAVLALCAYGVAEAIRGILAQRLSNRFSLDYSDNIFGYLLFTKPIHRIDRFPGDRNVPRRVCT